MSRAERAAELFEAALALAPEERRAFLERETERDAELREEVESLLEHHDRAQSFLDSSAVEEALAERRPTAIGPFRIVRELGRGGMGVVYLAEQEQPRREVALKVLRPGFASPSTLRRFEHEAQMLARLSHPGVAGIYQAGTADWGQGPQPYFAMELVRGPQLSQFVAARSLGTRQRVALLAQVCEAVAHAHSRGVVHRDLKPSNVLVDDSSDPPQVKVLDFGVARVVDDQARATSLRTDVGQVVGTLAYMSPEQAAGDTQLVDERSDVYSLGVVGYELLCGQLPLDVVGRPLHEALRRVREDEPTPLSRVQRALRGDLDTIFAHALEKERERRYASAAALAADLRRYLDDRPIEARPPSRSYLVAKFARRNRVLVGGVLAVLVALVIGIVGTGWQAVAAADARDRASQLAEDATAERDRADAQARRAETVLRFQRDMLARVRPQNEGRNVLLVDVLDAAAAELPGEFADDPASEAGVRETLGVSYHSLGLLQPAREQLERAVELFTLGLGERSVEALTARTGLARVLNDLGESERALELGREAYEALRETAGPTHESTLIAELDYSRWLDRTERSDEGFELARANLARRRAIYGDEHRLTVVAVGVVGNLLWRRGRFEEAEPFVREAFELGLGLEGERTPGSLTRRSVLANCLRLLGRRAEAEAHYRRALELGREVLGEEHVDVWTWMNNLAGVLQDQREYGEAEMLLREVVEVRERVLGPSHEDTLVARNNLALLLSSRGSYAEAEALHCETLERKRERLGDDHRSTLLSIHNLALALYLQGRVEEALPLFEECATRAPNALPAGHFQIAAYRESLGACLFQLGRLERAEAELRTALEQISASLPAGDARISSVAGRLAKLLDATGRVDEAAQVRERFAPVR